MPDYTSPNPNPAHPEPVDNTFKDASLNNDKPPSNQDKEQTSSVVIDQPLNDEGKSENQSQQSQSPQQNPPQESEKKTEQTTESTQQPSEPTQTTQDSSEPTQTAQQNQPAQEDQGISPTEPSNTSAQSDNKDGSAVVVNTTSGGGSDKGSKLKKFALPVLGVLLLVGAVASGVALVGQNQNIEEEASENCTPPTAGDREWWSVEILGNRANRPSTDTGQITGLEPGPTEVIVEAWSDSAFGCGTNQSDETAEVVVNGELVTVTDTDVPGSATVQVNIGSDGTLDITATATGNPGSMFVFVRVPPPPTVQCEIPPADGRLILNFVDQNSLIQSLEQAQSLNVNTAGSSYRVLIHKVDPQNNKEFFVVLINNDTDEVFITRTGSIDNLPTDLEGYDQLSSDSVTLSPDESALESLLNSYTGQDPESISVICASFEEYEFEPEVTPTQPVTDLGVTCDPVTAYDTSWNPLSSSELSDLQPGDEIRFEVSYTKENTTSTVDKARFRINSGSWNETAQSRSDGSYYWDYTIPVGTTAFNIEAEVHLLDNDTWY